MSQKQILHTKVKSIVEANYINGFVLNCFGIKFYNYFDETLEEVCKKYGLNASYLITELEKEVSSANHQENSIEGFSAELIISYLKQSHYSFIKKKLPYLAQLISDYKSTAQVHKDLKILFPLFAEDFIHHIYEEEDTLFSYIQVLNEFLDGHSGAEHFFFRMKRFSMKAFASEHEAHDDEMQGIRSITDNYKIDNLTDLTTKVLYYELQKFEKELITHAHIENNILFPKAIELEKKAQKKLKLVAYMN